MDIETFNKCAHSCSNTIIGNVVDQFKMKHEHVRLPVVQSCSVFAEHQCKKSPLKGQAGKNSPLGSRLCGVSSTNSAFRGLHIQIYNWPEKISTRPDVFYLRRSSVSQIHMYHGNEREWYLVGKCKDCWRCCSSTMPKKNTDRHVLLTVIISSCSEDRDYEHQ